MKEKEKLRTLLPHWMEHNSGHEEECGKWSEIARKEGMETVADHIDTAIKTMREVNKHLHKALVEAGGPLESGGTHHHHHH